MKSLSEVSYWKCIICGKTYNNDSIIWFHPICYGLKCGGRLIPKYEYEIINSESELK